MTITPLAPREAIRRLAPAKAALFMAGVRQLNGVYKDNGVGWLGHIDWFKAADSIGIYWKVAENAQTQWESWGLVEGRNNYDGWLLPPGLEVFKLLESQNAPTLPQLSDESSKNRVIERPGAGSNCRPAV